jgi:hypothetical protein
MHEWDLLGCGERGLRLYTNTYLAVCRNCIIRVPPRDGFLTGSKRRTAEVLRVRALLMADDGVADDRIAAT